MIPDSGARVATDPNDQWVTYNFDENGIGKMLSKP